MKKSSQAHSSRGKPQQRFKSILQPIFQESYPEEHCQQEIFEIKDAEVNFLIQEAPIDLQAFGRVEVDQPVADTRREAQEEDVDGEKEEEEEPQVPRDHGLRELSRLVKEYFLHFSRRATRRELSDFLGAYGDVKNIDRRLYDILHIMEGCKVIYRTGKSEYQWFGPISSKAVEPRAKKIERKKKKE